MAGAGASKETRDDLYRALVKENLRLRKLLVDGRVLTREDHLLIKVMEECNEISQRASKALRFGMDDIQAGHDRNNAQRLSDEYLDLVAVFILLAREFPDLLIEFPKERLEERRQRIEKYLMLSEELGRLVP